MSNRVTGEAHVTGGPEKKTTHIEQYDIATTTCMDIYLNNKTRFTAPMLELY